MLVLARKPGQTLHIGDHRLTVLGVANNGLAQLRIKTTHIVRMGWRLFPVPADGSPCVLPCRAGEGFRIGEAILVSIARVTPARVVLAIDADPNIRIDREENLHPVKQHG